MNKLQLVFLVLLVHLLLFTSCQKDEFQVGKGSLNVTVYRWGNSLTEHVAIYTAPETLAGKTDSLGTLMINDLPEGKQILYANLEGYGSFEGEFRVKSGKVTTVYIELLAGTTLSIAPKIVRFAPNDLEQFTFGDTIKFTFKLIDSDSKMGDISVSVSSNLNGDIFSGQPDFQRNVKFQTDSLEIGIHTITVKSTDKEGHCNSLSFSLNNETPGAITLTKVEKVGTGISLNWEPYLKKDFLKYNVFVWAKDQPEPTLLTVINEAHTTSYFDTVPLLCKQADYYIQMVNTKNKFSQSSSFNMLEPGGVVYPLHASVAVHHPTLPIVYIADNEGKKLYAINHETKQILTSIAMDFSIHKLHVADNGFGVEVYLPANNGNVKILNPLTLELVKMFNVGIYVTSITSNEKGLLFISSYTPKYPVNYVSCYSRATTTLLGGSNTMDLDGDEDLDYVPNTNNRLIAISVENNPSLKYVNFTAEGIFKSCTYVGNNSFHELAPKRTTVDPNGNYFVTGYNGAVYSTDTRQQYIGKFPYDDRQMRFYAINPQGNRIFAAMLTPKKIVQVKFPEFEVLGEYKTSGYPVFVFYYNGKMVVISSTYYWTFTNVGYGIEVKTIPNSTQ